MDGSGYKEANGRDWALFHLIDPHPERWGQMSIENVLHILHTSEEGLTTEQATKRFEPPPAQTRRNQLLATLFDQINSPLIAIYAAGAGLSLFLGSIGDAGHHCRNNPG